MALTRTTSQTERLPLQRSAAEAFEIVHRSLLALGKVKDANPTFRRIVGSIRAGGLNLNKCDLTITIEPVSDTASMIVIVAIAQEGLISQSTAGGAVTRLLAAVENQTALA